MKSEKELLLKDEKQINKDDYEERLALYNTFIQMPEEFFSKLRHFQPQIGCLNCCSFCSKSSSPTVEYWCERRIRNVVSALKCSAKKYKKNKPFIVWDRKNHRNEVIFSYTDNDIGNYKYLDKFVNIVFKELGVKTRISTVGYSRYNKELNKIHKCIASHPEYLGGVRLSFTPYAMGWCSNNKKFSKEDYTLDISNFLKIYYPYYNVVGSGSRKMCVELRYKPFIMRKPVTVGEVNEHMYIYTNKYLYVSKEKNIKFNVAQIVDPLDHSIKLSEEAIEFYYIYLKENVDNIENYIKINFNKITKKLVDVFMMKNDDGIYYSVEPSIKENGNYGINIYPITDERLVSGYIITERFFVNTLINYKKGVGLGKKEKFESATWNDVENVLVLLHDLANKYKNEGNDDKSNYIISNIMPMIVSYSKALKLADYSASCFFDPEFTIDTGIICNLGRAVEEFKGLTNKLNNPMTPTHERNYGKKNSTMLLENEVWKLNCNYKDTIVIEKLNLSNTATEEGQVVFKKSINLKPFDKTLTIKDLTADYLVPGQRKIEK